MQTKISLLAVTLSGAALWLAAGAANAGELTGSISLGKTKTKSETTVTVSPDGGTVTSTTRTETRGGGFDISFGRDRRHSHGDWRHSPRGRWDGRRGPYLPYVSPRYEPYPPRYPVYGPAPGAGPTIRIGIPTERTEIRRETIIIRPPGPVIVTPVR